MRGTRKLQFEDFWASLIQRSISHDDLCNSHTMVSPSVCGDNPRDLASGVSLEQVDNHGIFRPPSSV